MTAVPSTEPSPGVLDGGGPLFLPASEADAPGWALLTSACDNPDCVCDRLYIEARPLDRLDAPGPAHEDQDGPAFTFDPATRTVEDPGTGDSAWMVLPLRSPEWQDRLHRRWRAIRAESGDPRFCPPPDLQVDPNEGMVYFNEVFTEGFDLLVQVGDETYLGHDAYCLQPGCRCDEACVEIDRLDEQGQCHPVGVVPPRSGISSALGSRAATS